MSTVVVLTWVFIVLRAGWATRPVPRLAHIGGAAVPERRRVARVFVNGRGRRAKSMAVVSELPDVIDLLALAVGAGLNVTLALTAVAGRAPPHWHPALAAAVERVASGERLGDALADLPVTLGEPARPLAAALAASARYGTPLLPALERLAAEARADRRRRAEVAARRLPVALLFPLVLCVLPAFGLLTLVPSLAGALGALRL